MLNLQPLREQIYKYLRQEMQTGDLLPGSTINVSKLSSELGVSKTPLRDALIQLEAKGFVKILPRRGVRVSVLSLKDIENLYEILGSLETSVLTAVFDKFDKNRIEDMEQVNSKYKEAILSGNFEHIYLLNLAFHGSFLKLSDNVELQGLIEPLKQRLYDFPRRAYISEWEIRNADEHDQLIGFIKSGDRDAANKLMREVHWSYDYNEDFIRQFYALSIEEYRAEMKNIKARAKM